jgi:DNA processing protein
MLPGVGCARLERLRRDYPDPGKLLAEPAGVLAQLGLPVELEAKLPWAQVAREHELAGRAVVEILGQGDAGFPAALRDLPGGGPPLLYRLGIGLEPGQRTVAIVGTRRATPAGLETARRLAAELAEAGTAIVSGLARGIDTAAHKGALEAKGRTLAVLASGLLQVYPPENRDLTAAIAGAGAALTEYPLHAEPMLGAFLRRNRWIAALAEVTILVEAPAGSGALKTARHARDLGRPVLVVPGPRYADSWAGSNRLMREGAEVLTGAGDVLERLGLSPAAKAAQGELWPEPQQAVWECLEALPQTVEEITSRSGLTAAEVRSALVSLELSGALRRHPGPLFGLP